MITALLLLLAASPTVGTGDWPHLRGPAYDGTATSSVFQQSAVGLEVAWRRPLGSGYSGVTVADGVAVTMCSDGRSDVVVAFDAASGEERWRFRLGPTHRGHDGSADGPLSTPTIAGDVVYALGPFGRLVALSRPDGSLKWSRDLPTELEARAPELGFTTTPVVAGDVVVVQAGGARGRGLCAVDAQTGALRWSLGDEAVEYQSPVLMTLAGRPQLVAVRGESVVGHDPQTGAVLWAHALGPRDVTGSAVPVRIGDRRVATLVASGLLVLEVTRAGEGFEVAEAMRTRQLGGTYAPPVRHGDHLYGFRRDFLTCVDAATGERVWTSRPPGGRGLVLVDDRLVIFAAHGRLVVARATPEGFVEEAGIDALAGSSYTWPSVADDHVYLRNHEEIAAVRLVAGGPRHQASGDAAAGGDNAFARFLAQLEAADDPPALLASFLSRHPTMPIIEGDLVHFVYTGEADDVAISSPLSDMSRPDAMHRVAGTNLFHRTYRVEPGARIEYMYQVDLERWEPDPTNPRRVPGPWGGLEASEVLLPGYEEPTHLAAAPGDTRGRLESIAFRSERLANERTVQVYLPRVYDEQPETRFPLLVVQDGQNWIDKGLFVNTLDNITGRSVAPVVVAFVPSIDEWWLEAGGSRTAEFIDAVAEELVPQLAQRYRLDDASDRRAIHGHRDYGLTAVYAALRRPDVFGKAAAQSVGLRNGAQHQLLELIGKGPRQDVDLWIDWNAYEARGVDHGFDFGADGRTLVDALERRGYECAGGRFADSHGWAGWRSRTDRLLGHLFPLRGP